MLTVLEDSQFGPSHCDCCGNRSFNITGWLSDQSGTVAAYFVHWTEGRPDHGSNFDLIVGKWGPSASANDRSGASLEYRRDHQAFMVVDASDRPFSKNQDLFSHVLTREAVVGTKFADELFQLVDAIWLQDSRIGEVRGEHS